MCKRSCEHESGLQICSNWAGRHRLHCQPASIPFPSCNAWRAMACLHIAGHLQRFLCNTLPCFCCCLCPFSAVFPLKLGGSNGAITAGPLHLHLPQETAGSQRVLHRCGAPRAEAFLPQTALLFTSLRHGCAFVPRPGSTQVFFCFSDSQCGVGGDCIPDYVPGIGVCANDVSMCARRRSYRRLHDITPAVEGPRYVLPPTPMDELQEEFGSMGGWM